MIECCIEIDGNIEVDENLKDSEIRRLNGRTSEGELDEVDEHEIDQGNEDDSIPDGFLDSEGTKEGQFRDEFFEFELLNNVGYFFSKIFI